MRLSVLSDSNWEAKIDHATKCLDLKSTFESRDYGPSLNELCIILNCRDPQLGHKQRIRLTKATKTLSIDIMLALESFTRVPHEKRRSQIADTMCNETERILRKYSLCDFDTEKFIADFRYEVTNQLLSPEAARFDHLCLP
jgi:hypothetical protein